MQICLFTWQIYLYTRLGPNINFRFIHFILKVFYIVCCRNWWDIEISNVTWEWSARMRTNVWHWVYLPPFYFRWRWFPNMLRRHLCTAITKKRLFFLQKLSLSAEWRYSANKLHFLVMYLLIYVPRSNQIMKDNLDHNPSSTAAHGSFHETGISIIKQPTNGNSGIYGTQSEFEMVQQNIKPLLSVSYVLVVSMKAATISVQQIRTGLGTGQYILLATYRVTIQSEQINPLAYLAHKVSPQPIHPHTMADWVVFFDLRQALWEEPFTIGKPNFKTLIVIDTLNL